jgi:SAM-dependent methyltransferase
LTGDSGRGLPLQWADRYPCLYDRTPTTGFDRHYVYHTAWAARVLASTRPPLHVDIGSSVYFNALISAFMPVAFFDLRPAHLRLEGYGSGAADLLALPFADNSIRSLSCMHVIEHVGLGRYGGALDPDADLVAMGELGRVVAPGGDLLFVTPVGRPRIQFNAHRIYSYEQVLGYFSGFQLRQFALVTDTDKGDGLQVDPGAAAAGAQAYGCGCFWFRKQ